MTSDLLLLIIYLIGYYFYHREQLLRVLNGMVNDNFLPALKECRRPQLCLRSTLEQLLTELKPVENQDEIDMCSELLDKVFFEPDTNQER